MNRFSAALLPPSLKSDVRRGGVVAAVVVTLFATGARAQLQQIVVDFPVAGAGAAPYLGSGSPMIGPGGTLQFHLTQNATIQSVTFDATQGDVHELAVSAVHGCTQGAHALVTAAGTECSVDYFLTPIFAGLRERAGTFRVVTDRGSYAAGVSFTATGPQVVFTPGTISSLTLDASKATGAFALDAFGNRYIALPAANIVERVDAKTGVVTLIAGNGSATASGDGGVATAAGVPNPVSVAVAPSGDVYVVANDVTAYYETVRKIDAKTGLISTLSTFESYGLNGSVLADRDGFVYLAAPYDGDLLRVSQSGGVTALACYSPGHPPPIFPPPVIPPPPPRAIRPTAIALDGNGHIFFISNNGGSSDVYVTTLPPADCYNNFSKVASGFSGATGLAADAAGNLYVSDTGNNRVLKLATGTYTATTVAGTGMAGHTGDGGAATSAELQGAGSLALDPLGNLYVLDTADNVVRLIDRHDAALGFPDTALGVMSAAEAATLENVGSMDLALTPPTNGGTNPSVTGGFVLGMGGTCPVLPGSASATIAIGANCTQQVQFLPQGSGGITGTLTFVDNAGGSQVGMLAQTVALSGNGKAADTHPPGITLLSPSSVDFGTLPEGTVSNAWTVNVSNTGAVATKISAIFLSDPYDFKETNNCGATLAAYSSCQVLVSFSPEKLGYLTATLEVDDDLVPYHQSIPLSGNANGTGVQLAPSSIDFGSLTQYTTGNSWTVNVSNTGGSAVKIASIYLSDGYNFKETNNCGSTLAAYSSCQVLVSFSPVNTGSIAGNLMVDDDAAPYHLSIPVSGTSVAAAAPNYTVSLSPAAMSVRAGETGAAAFTFAPTGGFQGAVTFTCAGLPNGAACSFAPATLRADGSDKVQVSQLTVTTSWMYGAHAMNQRTGGNSLILAAVVGLNGMLVGFVFVRQRVKPAVKALVLAAMLAGLGAASGCGSGVLTGSTVAGTTAVTVTAAGTTPTGTGMAKTTSFVLTITQ